MLYHHKQNPACSTGFDDIIEISSARPAVFSLGDSLRPGPPAIDASDAAQFAELKTLASSPRRAWEHESRLMVEGPGPRADGPDRVQRQKQMEECRRSSFYVLGPLVTDNRPRYDHINQPIGAGAAGWHGTAMLCYVTPQWNTWACQRRRRARG